MNVVGMTYDPVSVLAEFSEAGDIGYPLLSDPGGQYMHALGIRNEEYAPGHRGHGIPHPGIMLIDPDRVIRFKAAIPGYRDRPPFDEVLAAVTGAVE